MIDRHYRLQTRLRELYRNRSEGLNYQSLLREAREHLRLMPAIVAALKADRPDGSLPYIETFLLLERSLCEKGEYDAARSVWRVARRSGYLEADGDLQLHLDDVAKRQGKRSAAAASNQVPTFLAP